VFLACSPRPLRLRSAVCAGKHPLPQWTHDRGPRTNAVRVLATSAHADVCASPGSRLTLARASRCSRLASFALQEHPHRPFSGVATATPSVAALVHRRLRDEQSRRPGVSRRVVLERE